MRHLAKSFLLVFVVLCTVSCAGGPQKAMNYGAALTEVYKAVNTEAVAIRGSLSADDAVLLSDVMIRAGEALRAYNLATMTWFTTQQRPVDYAAVSTQLREALAAALTLLQEFKKSCSLKS